MSRTGKAAGFAALADAGARGEGRGARGADSLALVGATRRILRVFPRRTAATPRGPMVRIAEGPGLFDEADEVWISVAFTWDLAAAERLAREWRHVATVRVGGPATGEQGGDFEADRFMAPGYTITSRGCPNKCWFCSVWRREGQAVRELPIVPGWNVCDDNLLACSDAHIRAVFAMLGGQPRAPQFTGGLEAARLQPWHAEAMKALHTKTVFFAYDTGDDLEPLRAAGALMRAAGFTAASHALRCYVLCGWAADTIPAANRRMEEAVTAGFMPMAMCWRGEDGRRARGWSEFQRSWARPAAVATTMRRMEGK